MARPTYHPDSAVEIILVPEQPHYFQLQPIHFFGFHSRDLHRQADLPRSLVLQEPRELEVLR